MSTDFVGQGLEWLMNKKEKVEKIFNRVEGFNRMAPGNNILGNPNLIPPISNSIVYSSIDDVNKMEQATLDLSSNDLAQNISNYNQAYKKLNVKRNEYLGDIKKYSTGRNYNIFVNRLSDLATIRRSPVKCVTIANNDNKYTKQDTGSTTFSTKEDAIQACSIIASDSDKPWYAIKKTTSGDFTCSLGATGPEPNSNYTKTVISYTLQSSEKATRAGLFMNGQIGIYNDSNPANKTDISATAIPAAGANCNPWVGGAINKSSIQATYGKNQSNMTITPKKVKKLVYKANQNADYNLQISRIAIYATINGRSENVANKIANNDSIVINGGDYGGTGGKLAPIKPNLINASWNDIYASATTDKANTWTLNLDKEYDVFRVVFYNRSDCCQERAIGTTITLYNEKGDLVQEFTLTGDSYNLQTFNLTQT
jgi:hypothetical protein